VVVVHRSRMWDIWNDSLTGGCVRCWAGLGWGQRCGDGRIGCVVNYGVV